MNALFDLYHPDMPPCFPPAQTHSETSVAAAAGVIGKKSRLQAAVYVFVAGRGQEGATDHEIADALATSLGCEPASLRPRRIELVKRGLVRDSGRTRTVRTGNKATVWIACNAAPCLRGQAAENLG